VRRLAPLLALLALAGPARAQTNDHFFRSWRFALEPSSPRAAGLGGAVAALGDDPGAALANPAGLANLPKSEVQAALRLVGAGSSAVGDSLDSQMSPSAAVLAWRPREGLVIAPFIAQPYVRGLTLHTAPLADGFSDSGFLQGSVTDIGVALAWRVGSFVQLGARGAASRLSLDGDSSRDPAAGATQLRVETGGHNTQPTGSIGVLFTLTPRVQLGLLAASGAAWPVTRTASSPALGVVLEPSGRYEIRAPRVASAGIALEPSRRLALFGQIDYVAYRDVQSGIVIGQGAHARNEYSLPSAWEPRAGVELSVPRPTFSLQFRGGVHLQAPGLIRYLGSDPVERVAFGGERRRVVPSAGASLVTRWLRVDVAVRLGEQFELLAGAAARF
jgi:hypothetical protein